MEKEEGATQVSFCREVCCTANKLGLSDIRPLQLSPQYLAALVVSGLGNVSIGTVVGFSAVLLPQLEDEGIVAAKSDQASWIGESVSRAFFPLVDR